MSGIQAVQGSTTINSGGAHSVQNQRGLVVKTAIVFTMVNGASAYDWTLERPGNSAVILGDGSQSSVSFTPDVPGSYVVRERVTGAEMQLIISAGVVSPDEATMVDTQLTGSYPMPCDTSALSESGLVVSESTATNQKAIAATENTSAPVIGSNADATASGKVIVAGLVNLRAAETLTITRGDVLYVSGTAGKVSNVAPDTTGHYIKQVAIARKSVSASADTLIEAVWCPATPVAIS